MIKRFVKILLVLIFAIIFGGCTLRQEEKNINTQTHKGVSEFEYNGHRYIRFQWGFERWSTAGVVHNPDCPCFNNDSVK